MKKSPKSKTVRKAPAPEWDFSDDSDGIVGQLVVDGRHCCVFTKWDSDGLHILLFDYEAVKAWSGLVTEHEVAEMSSSLQMSVDEFKKETETALQPRASSASGYQYTLEDSIFAWKKVVSEGIQFDFGAAAVHETSADKVISFFFNKLLRSNSSLNEELEQVKKRGEQLEKERRMLLQRCESYVSGKERMEADLYSRFAAVLNAKKARISELMSAPANTESTSEDGPVQRGKAAKKSTRKNSNEGERSSANGGSDEAGVYDEETDVDTDEEREMENERRKKRKML